MQTALNNKNFTTNKTNQKKNFISIFGIVEPNDLFARNVVVACNGRAVFNWVSKAARVYFARVLLRSVIGQKISRHFFNQSLACVSSVSVSAGFSVRSKHFYLFGRAKVGTRAAKKRKKASKARKRLRKLLIRKLTNHKWNQNHHDLVARAWRFNHGQNVDTVSITSKLIVTTPHHQVYLPLLINATLFWNFRVRFVWASKHLFRLVWAYKHSVIFSPR